jgi:hypothetical protein
MQISDIGLSELARLPSLKNLNLRETRVSEAGIVGPPARLPGRLVWFRSQPVSGFSRWADK